MLFAALSSGLDKYGHNIYVASVLPPFTAVGLLPPGTHRANWEELASRFGGTPKRDRLLQGLLEAATNLRDAGALVLWLDGSFVTSKPDPGDFDGVWDWSGVDLRKVDPILTDANDLRSGRFKQKAKYGGELLIELGKSRLKQFFQQTRDGNVKGIVLLDLRTLP